MPRNPQSKSWEFLYGGPKQTNRLIYYSLIYYIYIQSNPPRSFGVDRQRIAYHSIPFHFGDRV